MQLPAATLGCRERDSDLLIELDGERDLNELVLADMDPVGSQSCDQLRAAPSVPALLVSLRTGATARWR